LLQRWSWRSLVDVGEGRVLHMFISVQRGRMPDLVRATGLRHTRVGLRLLRLDALVLELPKERTLSRVRVLLVRVPRPR
jgi:hypothetical protein